MNNFINKDFVYTFHVINNYLAKVIYSTSLSDTVAIRACEELRIHLGFNCFGSRQGLGSASQDCQLHSQGINYVLGLL